MLKRNILALLMILFSLIHAHAAITVIEHYGFVRLEGLTYARIIFWNADHENIRYTWKNEVVMNEGDTIPDLFTVKEFRKPGLWVFDHQVAGMRRIIDITENFMGTSTTSAKRQMLSARLSTRTSVKFSGTLERLLTTRLSVPAFIHPSIMYREIDIDFEEDEVLEIINKVCIKYGWHSHLLKGELFLTPNYTGLQGKLIRYED